MTAVGFEPTPLRNGALSHRLGPLGQTVLTCRLAGWKVSPVRYGFCFDGAFVGELAFQARAEAERLGAKRALKTCVVVAHAALFMEARVAPDVE